MDFNKIWISLLAFGFAVEMWALFNGKPGDTLSERTRDWFEVHQRPGWIVFAVAWVAFSAWFFIHILL